MTTGSVKVNHLKNRCLWVKGTGEGGHQEADSSKEIMADMRDTVQCGNDNRPGTSQVVASWNSKKEKTTFEENSHDIWAGVCQRACWKLLKTLIKPNQKVSWLYIITRKFCSSPNVTYSSEILQIGRKKCFPPLSMAMVASGYWVASPWQALEES